MLAEAGICGNRGVADGGPFVGPGLFQPVCIRREVGGGALNRAPFFFFFFFFFLRRPSLAGQIIEGDLDSCGITAHSEKACRYVLLSQECCRRPGERSLSVISSLFNMGRRRGAALK